MFGQIKNLIQKNRNNKRFFEANDYVTVVPFLFGAQLENRRLGRYIFISFRQENPIPLGLGMNCRSISLVFNIIFDCFF